MLAILTTHPIQYQVPLWQALARDGRVPFEVWYLTSHAVQPSRDRDFGQAFAWDIDTLSGYPHRFLAAAEGASPSSFWGCRLRERLAGRLRTSGATALWIQGWQVAAYWQAAREARSAGVEVWLRGESNDLGPKVWWKQPVKRLSQRWLFGHVSKFLYIGAANRRLYESHRTPASRLYPAPYAVDNGRFARQAAELRSRRSELRREWGIPEDAFCVLFCGKLIGKKRPGDLIEAARRLVSGGMKVHLLFAGSGALGGKLRRECEVVFDAEDAAKPSVARHGGPPASFAGFLNQTAISRAYVAADCLALPSDHRETWGLVVNEAMASGLPCVVSDACGCAEDLAEDALRFRLGDTAGLAGRLLEMSRRPVVPAGPPSIASGVESIVRAFGDRGEFEPRGITLEGPVNTAWE